MYHAPNTDSIVRNAAMKALCTTANGYGFFVRWQDITPDEGRDALYRLKAEAVNVGGSGRDVHNAYTHGVAGRDEYGRVTG